MLCKKGKEQEGNMQAETPQTMKAIQIHTYGGPEVLVYENVLRPTAGLGEVLIRVFAAGLYPGDWYIRSGYANLPEEIRLSLLTRFSLPLIPGTQVSGIVEAVGPDVTSFHEGDAVYGLIRFPSGGAPAGAYAEYVTAPAAHLALKPASIDHLQAAAVPMVALFGGKRASRFNHIALAMNPLWFNGRRTLRSAPSTLPLCQQPITTIRDTVMPPKFT
jgi:NADPH:quinone reductase-like Zn-dependent oxidoreductase